MEGRRFGTIRMLPSGNYQARRRVSASDKGLVATFSSREGAEKWLLKMYRMELERKGRRDGGVE